MQWNKTIGGNDYDYMYSLYQSKDGGYLLSGYSYTNVSVDKTDSSKGRTDIWLVKLDASGNIEWNRSVGGNKEETNAPMVATSDGGFIVGASTASRISGDKTQAGTGYWIIKYDSLYNVEWDKVIGSKGSDALTVIQQTSDNGYILGGYSNGGAGRNKTDSSRGDFDYWIVKLDAAHNITWDKTFGGNRLDYLYSVTETSDHGFILGGYSRSDNTGDKSEGNISDWYYGDYWVVKTDRNGNKSWDKTLGGYSYDWLYDVQEVKPNTYLAAGGGSGLTAGLGAGDYYLVQLQYHPTAATVTATTLHAASQATALQAYPNPVTSVLYVNTTGKQHITLTSQRGKVVYNGTISGAGKIDVHRFSGGIYYLHNIATGETIKVVIQH